MAPKRRADDPIAFLEKKNQAKRPSPLSQGVSVPDDHDQEHDDGARWDAGSGVETEDSSKAADRWQELKAAKTEEEEIERFKREQARAHTKPERDHNEALHEVRLRMLRARKGAREVTQKAAQKSALEVYPNTKQGKGKD